MGFKWLTTTRTIRVKSRLPCKQPALAPADYSFFSAPVYENEISRGFARISPCKPRHFNGCIPGPREAHSGR